MRKFTKKKAEIYKKDIESIFEPVLKDGKPVNLFEGERKVNHLKETFLELGIIIEVENKEDGKLLSPNQEFGRVKLPKK